MFKKPWLVVAALAVFSLLGPGTAQADSISFDINSPNAALSSYTGPYASVTVNVSGSGVATISVTTYSGFFLGDGGTFAINPSAGTPGAVTYSGCGPADPTCANVFDAWGSGNVSDFGSFSSVLKDNDGVSEMVTGLSFSLTGATFASASDVLTLNSDGFLAAVHIFAGCNAERTDCALTGFAANGDPNVPEPATLLLLGTGLLGGGFSLVRRRRRA